MILFYKKFSSFLLSVAAIFFLGGCSSVLEEGEVSTSTSSSERGDGFIVLNDSAHTHTASVVVGQANFISNADNITSAYTVSTPYGNPTVVDGMLYLPDFGNNRLVGHNTTPTTNGAAADFAVGQDTLNRSDIGNSEYRNAGAQTVTVANGKLFLTDWGNSRILIYNQRPISEPAKADVVVGQIGFYRSDPATKANRLNYPESLYVVDDKLIVADSENNRVLIWNTIPTSNGAAADIVLGQNNFDTNTTVTPPTASSLNFPTALWSDGINLVVLDAGNNRILIWNSLATLASGDNADAVLGQLDFTSNLANQGLALPTAATLSFSTDGGGLYSNAAQQLFVADSGNHRILVWDFPLTTAKAASGLIGQNDFDRYLENRGGTTNADTLSNPTGVYQFYNKLIVTDNGNNRYLIFYSQ